MPLPYMVNSLPSPPLHYEFTSIPLPYTVNSLPSPSTTLWIHLCTTPPHCEFTSTPSLTLWIHFLRPFPLHSEFTSTWLPYIVNSLPYPFPTLWIHFHTPPLHCDFTSIPLPLHCEFTSIPLPLYCEFTSIPVPLHCEFTSMPIPYIVNSLPLPPLHYKFTSISLPYIVNSLIFWCGNPCCKAITWYREVILSISQMTLSYFERSKGSDKGKHQTPQRFWCWESPCKIIK